MILERRKKIFEVRERRNPVKWGKRARSDTI